MKRTPTELPILHVITDPEIGGHGHRALARAAFAGGADVVQLRDKMGRAAELVSVAREIQKMAEDAGKLFVVNDHLELAREVGAGGLHLGPDDLPMDSARAAWARPLVLGGSARTADRARWLEEAGADYLGVGPVFGTTTKPDAPGRIGLERVFEITRAVSIPVIGIGGVTASNAGLLIATGARGVAVLAAVARACDPESVVRSIRLALDEAARRHLE